MTLPMVPDLVGVLALGVTVRTPIEDGEVTVPAELQ